MLNFILNKIFPPMPALVLSAPPPFSEANMDEARDRARELTGSGPTFREDDMKAVLRAMETILNQPVAPAKPAKPAKRMRSPTRSKYPFHDLEVGQSCRVPNSVGLPARAAAYTYAYETGKRFKTKSHANGFWIKRVA